MREPELGEPSGYFSQQRNAEQFYPEISCHFLVLLLNHPMCCMWLSWKPRDSIDFDSITRMER